MSGLAPAKPTAPMGFAFSRTGDGAQGTWVVQADKDAPSAGQVLAQTDADATDTRYPFLHYWGVGRTEDLARTIKAALDQNKHD